MPNEWNISDRRWRELTYLDYASHVPYATGGCHPHLDSVERVRFAADQPEQFADFSGRLADLGIRYLRTEGQRNWQLLFGLATSGVRVPGTKYVLRVARPWYAFFEERLGEFHPLPNDWMECVRLVRCPGGGIEWLGRRHPMAHYAGFDWSGFREMPSGWKRERPAGTSEMDDGLRHEVDRVLAEIGEFSEHLLPEMAIRDPRLFPDERYVTRLADGAKENHPLIEWQVAAARLAGALCADAESLPRIYNAGEFRDLMNREPNFNYVVREGRIRWHFKWWRREWRETDRLPEEYHPTDPHDKGQCLAAMKRWLLAPLTRSNDVWNALFWAVPAIADTEPNFAWKMLDIRMWRERVLADTVLTEAERQNELSKTYCYFNYVVNNALLHVVDTLADNNFMEIRRFLDLPSFRGGYTSYMPQYLFETLFAKVQVLTDLRLCSGRVIGPADPETKEANDDK